MTQFSPDTYWADSDSCGQGGQPGHSRGLFGHYPLIWPQASSPPGAKKSSDFWRQKKFLRFFLGQALKAVGTEKAALLTLHLLPSARANIQLLQTAINQIEKYKNDDFVFSNPSNSKIQIKKKIIEIQKHKYDDISFTASCRCKNCRGLSQRQAHIQIQRNFFSQFREILDTLKIVNINLNIHRDRRQHLPFL